MACIINADNGAISGSAGVKTTADSTGVLNIQTNGTTAISISASQAVSFTNTPTFTGGTANGVLYLNGSKVATSGSALTFDGTQTLSLFATGNAVTNLEGSTTNNAILRFRNGTTGALAGFYGNNSKELIFEANGTTEQMRLTSTGLGIGTTSPLYQVVILRRAGSTITQPLLNLQSQTSTLDGDSFILYGTQSANWAAGVDQADSNKFRIEPSTTLGGADGLTITTAGNLGIGTSTPGSKLHVATLTSETAVQVTNNNATVYLGAVYASNNFANGTVAGQGIVRSGAGIAFSANGGTSVQALLDSSGNLGLGVTPSAWGSGYKAFELSTRGANITGDVNFNYTYVGANNFHNGSAWTYKVNGFSTRYAQGDGTHLWYTAPSGTAGNAISFTQAMTLDASGNLVVGATAAGNANNNAFWNSPISAAGYFGQNHANGTTSGREYAFFAYNAAVIGSITQSGTTAVLYNTTSDKRLKTNIIDAPDASALIDSIKVRSFDWIADESHQRYGMVAQELAQVAPEAVNQPSNPDEMMAVDYSKLVPMLVKEIQSLRARVAQLETK